MFFACWPVRRRARRHSCRTGWSLSSPAGGARPTSKDGCTRRNPFNEYECGHWYARALSSYSLLEALSGVRYDAVDQALRLRPGAPATSRSFLATEAGFGTATVADGVPTLKLAR